MADKRDEVKKSIPTPDHGRNKGETGRRGGPEKPKHQGNDAPIVSNTYSPPVKPPKKG